ncbi:MAG: sigma-70 family RNA polymerase sigma factor [Chitinophagaceae bacterium]|nr:sigma-70 family RNA polymerase sigma factor [Chitinophagaceae bacterium]MBN8667640.1 sigma-70 family RNA polymerase sigma factor [Chitinophagales bacterium]
MHPDQKDKDLLKGLAINDKKAVERIYRENYATIQTLVINNNGNSDDAKDLFQEAMIVLYEKAKTGQFELNCQLKTYLYSVCRRLWLKRLQQVNRYSGELDNVNEVVPVEEDLEEHEQRNEEFRLMEKAIANLGEPCKSLIEAFYIQKRNMQEIASSFGYTNADNAKNQKYKCLMRLKKIFFSQYKNGNGNG